jgi:hypothetical protein
MSVRGIRLERLHGRHYLASMASLSASDFRELSVAERIQLVQDGPRSAHFQDRIRWSPVHASDRKAMTGSMREARRAGSHVASRATTARPADTAA